MKLNTILLVIGVLIVGYLIWKYAPEPTKVVADKEAQLRAQTIEVHYEQGCGVSIPTPLIYEDSLFNKVDVADPVSWSVTVDKTRWDEAKENVLNDTIPHGITHLIRNQQMGHTSMIHDGEFYTLEAYLRGQIKTCPKE